MSIALVEVQVLFAAPRMIIITINCLCNGGNFGIRIYQSLSFRLQPVIPATSVDLVRAASRKVSPVRYFLLLTAEATRTGGPQFAQS